MITSHEESDIEPLPTRFYICGFAPSVTKGVLVSLIVADYRSGRALVGSARRQGDGGTRRQARKNDARGEASTRASGSRWKLITADPWSTDAALVSASLSARGKSCIDTRSRNASLHGNAKGGFMGNATRIEKIRREATCSIRRARVRMVGPSLGS